MAEKVELHGGPRHGDTQEIPFDGSTSIEIVATFTVQGKTCTRRGRYTRVFDIANHPQKDFEWVGYTTAYIPSETDA